MHSESSIFLISMDPIEEASLVILGLASIIPSNVLIGDLCEW